MCVRVCVVCVFWCDRLVCVARHMRCGTGGERVGYVPKPNKSWGSWEGAVWRLRWGCAAPQWGRTANNGAAKGPGGLVCGCVASRWGSTGRVVRVLAWQRVGA